MRCSVWPLLAAAGLVAATGGGGAVDAAEILAISPIASGSHWTFMSSVLDVLLDRGHKVSVVTAYRRPVPHENYTHIDIAGSVDVAVASAWDVVSGRRRRAPGTPRGRDTRTVCRGFLPFENNKILVEKRHADQ